MTKRNKKRRESKKKSHPSRTDIQASQTVRKDVLETARRVIARHDKLLHMLANRPQRLS